MSEFKREDRYVVLKRKDVNRLPHWQKEALREILTEIENMMPPREYVVVESDWPEYETVWDMIQARVEGRPNQIATLQSELAERWENLNVQDGVIEGLREEIASWQRVHRAEYEKREALDARLAALEKVQTNLATFVRRLAYALRNHDGAAILRHQAHDYLTRNNLAGDPLREDGHLKENGDE